MALIDDPYRGPGSRTVVETNDGSLRSALLEKMPFYDRACEIARVDKVEISNHMVKL